jgi:aldehyde dehydrogenase (NAD+)
MQEAEQIETKEFTIPAGELYINGKWRPSQNGHTFPTFNPATEEEITQVAEATEADVNDAIAAARNAFDNGQWSTMSGHKRSQILFKIGDLILKYGEELAYRETVNMGMLYKDSFGICVPHIANMFYYYGGWSSKIEGSVKPVEGELLAYTVREPLGVVCAITPFNFPMVLSVSKLAPALACGNTVIHKPASATPLSAIKMAEIMDEAGVPLGVFNLVTGPGGSIGKILATHPDIDKIAITGSTNTGKQIIKDSADTLKHVTVELGGKSPDIIFADADLDNAVNATMSGLYFNKGEICFAGSRLLVEESIYDQVVSLLVERVKKTKTGDPLDRSTDMGPIADKGEYAKILHYIDIGQNEDKAKLAVGGKPLMVGNGKGYYIEPTLFINANNNMRIAREEIFGPVLVVIPFKNFDEAISIANDTSYGLASGVHTRDIKKAIGAAKALKAGTVWVNTYSKFDPSAPFGGYKASGYGREQGWESLDNYLQTKTVWLNINPLADMEQH